MKTTNQAQLTVHYNNRQVIKMLPDGTHLIDTGGWRSPAVCQVIDQAIKKLGYTITQHSGIWYVSPTDEDRHERYVFADGMKIRPSGKIVGADIDVMYPRVTKRAINRYVAGWSEAWLKGMHPPNKSDPHAFYVASVNKMHVNLAEMRQQMTDYYRGSYYFGSLLMVAVNEAGGTKTGKLDLIAKIHIQDWLQHGMLPPSQLLQGSALAIRRLLRNYLYKLHGIKSVGKHK